MAATTSYDGPNDEQLLAYTELEYADLPIYGSKLVEVFAVRVPGAAATSRGNRPSPCGMIRVFGAYCSQSLIFKGSRCDDPTSPDSCDRQGNLVLTGPKRIISAEGPTLFRIHLHDSSREFSLQENWENGVGIQQGYPHLRQANIRDSEYSLWPCGGDLSHHEPGRVECEVAVRLAFQDGEDPISLFGRIVARSKLFDIGCMLFYKEHVKGICARSGDLIPLARNVHAVPLYKPLVIELDLHSYDGDEIMRETLEFQPLAEGEQMARLISRSGAEIEVTISLSQYFR